MKNHPFKKLFAEPGFIKLWLSQMLSQLTINLVNFSILTRIFESTQSSLAVSFLWLAYSLPALFFAPFSGTIVDRYSRRKMMIATNLLQALVVSLYLLVQQQIFILYSLVFLYSLLDQLYLPSQQASIPTVVKESLLSSANGLFLITQQASFLVGFGLGGIFLSILGRDNTIVFSSIMLSFAAVSVYLLPSDSARKNKEHSLGLFWSDFKTGYDFVKEHSAVFFPLLMIVCSQIFITIITVILPSYTRSVLGLDLNHASLTFVLPGGLGALLFTSQLPKLLKKRRKKQIIESGLLVASVSLFFLSLLPQVPVFKIPLAIAISVGLGISIASIMVPSQTLLQEKTPTWFRGRVYGSLSFLLIIATSLPLLISATVADFLGVATMIGLISLILLAGLIFIRQKGDYVLANGLGV